MLSWGWLHTLVVQIVASSIKQWFMLLNITLQLGAIFWAVEFDFVVCFEPKPIVFMIWIAWICRNYMCSSTGCNRIPCRFSYQIFMHSSPTIIVLALYPIRPPGNYSPGYNLNWHSRIRLFERILNSRDECAIALEICWYAFNFAMLFGCHNKQIRLWKLNNLKDNEAKTFPMNNLWW